MKVQRLIEKYKKLEGVWDTPGTKTARQIFLQDLEQLDEPQPLKLKDIISRMKQLFPNNRSEWIDEILHEFGEEFGSIKYRSGYEQGKLEGMFIREKVTIPQFVADYIEWAKEEDYHLFGAMLGIKYHENKKVDNWFYTDDNIEIFARAWLDGYEVEKKKRYWVKLKAVDQYLVSAKDEKFLGFLQSKLRSKFTRKELEDLGFGWVFDCEGIEIEEVAE